MRKPNEVMIGDITLQEIIDNHSHWMKRDCDDWKQMRADLSGMDLQDIDFCKSNLRKANLSGANLSNCLFTSCDLTLADLSYSDLSGCYLSNVDLYLANLEHSNLYNVNLSDANLNLANLSGCCLVHAKLDFACLDHARLRFANLAYASLIHSNLSGANLSNAVIEYADFTNSDITEVSFDNAKGNNIEYRKGKILTESIIGYKKCRADHKYRCDAIVTLEIPKDAMVFSINGNKCRTNKAKVLSINLIKDESVEINRACSLVYNNLLNMGIKKHFLSYYIGDEINIKNFNCQYNIECAEGIHFFMTKEEAIKYRY